MARSHPPSRSSKSSSVNLPVSEAAPSVPPEEGAPAKGPIRRQTMEVQMAWLEPAPTITSTPDGPPPSSARKRPPRLPGASRTLPPMPVPASIAAMPAVNVPRDLEPPRRHTMEVEMNWLELVEEKRAKEQLADEAHVEAVAEEKPAEEEPAAASDPVADVERDLDAVFGDDSPPTARVRPASVRPSRPPSVRPAKRAASMRPAPAASPTKKKGKRHKPIPRED